jgi:hypothetical protein
MEKTVVLKRPFQTLPAYSLINLFLDRVPSRKWSLGRATNKQVFRLESGCISDLMRPKGTRPFPSLDSGSLTYYGEGSSTLRNPAIGFERIDLLW